MSPPTTALLFILAVVAMALALQIFRFAARKLPVDLTLWHEWDTMFPVVLQSGNLSGEGKLWRRKTARGWEYRQDPETEQEFFDRSW